MTKVLSILPLFLFSFIQSYSQVSPQSEFRDRKGHFFISWGYNRAYYNESDLHFKGDGYDFTLYDAKAEDIPEKFQTKVYLGPTQFTVPQYNIKVGYYIAKNTAILFAMDHMKYHLIQTQDVVIDGYIDPEKFPDHKDYTGTFTHDHILYTSEFMNFHHSDGFNFARLAIEQRVPFWQSKNGKHLLALTGTASLGLMVPWTDFTFFGTNYRNKPHIAGYGISLNTGFRYELGKYFYLDAQVQLGTCNMPDIMLQDALPARADQKITWLQRNWSIGAYIPFKKKNTPKT
jgi:hypothetical protein